MANTIRIFEEVEENATTKVLKDAILSEFPYDDYTIINKENGISIENAIEGKVFFPDKILKYYHNIYSDGLEHKGNFDRYEDDIIKAIESTDIEEKISVTKDMSKWFAFVQMHAESYSVAAYLLHRADLEREDMITLYSAYSQDDANNLDEKLKIDFTRALDNVLYYFKFLIGIFTVLD